MKILSKENVGKKKVYDITTKNTHTFVANNLVVHNCNAQQFCKNAKPLSVSDISVLTSIYRPGPLCLSENSTIFTGMCKSKTKRSCKYKTIKELYEKFHSLEENLRKKFPLYLFSFDEKNKTLVKNKILNVYKSGKKEVFSLKVRVNLTGPQQKMTSNQNKYWNLKSSIDHKFLTLNGWKSLKDINPGEYLLTQKKSLSHSDDPRKNTRNTKNIKGKKNFANICCKHYQYKCIFCDWKNGRLDVNHVEENRFKNNEYQNLSFLCPNHHREYSEGSISKNELLKEREKYVLENMEDFIYVQFLEKENCGEEETYDISVEAPNNNFIAGGFVVHNSGHADKKYIHLNENPEEIDFYHPAIKEVLEESKGLLVYQEQFMLLANKLAGFSLIESDELRKLLVKPIVSLGEQMKVKRIEVGQKFIDGCINNGISKVRAEKLWNDEILGFISYGFNKSHAVAYAYLSYQCAHLFYHYRDEWICSYLENDPNKDAATAEVEALGYKIGELDILVSGKQYSIVDNMIYPPFSSVKGIGDVAIEELLDLRQKWTKKDSAKENFESFFWDLEETQLKNGKSRVKRSWKFTKFNKRALLGLIRLEAIRGLGLFPDLFLNHAHMFRVMEKYWGDKDKQKFDLEAAAKDETVSTADFEDSERVTAQHELLGTYDKDLLITPEIIDFLRNQDIMPLDDLCEQAQNIWFILKDVSKEMSQNGKEYWKLIISDVTGKEQRLNYFFGEPRAGWKENSVYWAELFRNKGWINVKRGSFIRSLE